MPRSISSAAQMIIEERIRQQTQEGYTPAHDDEHTEGQLALLAAAYALSSTGDVNKNELACVVEALETYDWEFNPKSPIRDLTRAGALIVAAIEALLRAEEKKKMVEERTRFADLVQLPRWQSHKIVAADKIVAMAPHEPSVSDMSLVIWKLACGVEIQVSKELLARVPPGLPPVGGYFVRYEDNFASWSPAEAFEKGYTRI